MYQGSCNDDRIRRGESYVNFDCYAYEGQSGSPVWISDDEATGNQTVRGILSSGQPGENASNGEAGPGVFTIITETVYDEITQWMSSSAVAAGG